MQHDSTGYKDSKLFVLVPVIPSFKLYFSKIKEVIDFIPNDVNTTDAFSFQYESCREVA